MGIQSTMDITRAQALERIEQKDRLALMAEFMEIEGTTNETHGLQDFVYNYRQDHINLHKYTDTMLEDIMDLPFYRYSMFDNYKIED